MATKEVDTRVKPSHLFRRSEDWRHTYQFVVGYRDLGAMLEVLNAVTKNIDAMPQDVKDAVSKVQLSQVEIDTFVRWANG
jgi:hypothetical protein